MPAAAGVLALLLICNCAAEQEAARKRKCGADIRLSDICVLVVAQEYNSCTLNAATEANNSGNVTSLNIFQGCENNFVAGIAACFFMVPPECHGQDRATETDGSGITISP